MIAGRAGEEGQKVVPKRFGYNPDDVQWMMGQIGAVRAQGASAREAARKIVQPFIDRTGHALSLTALENLYWKHTRGLKDGLSSALVLAVNKNSGKAEVFADLDAVQEKLGSLAAGYDFYRARRLNVKLETRLVCG